MDERPVLYLMDPPLEREEIIDLAEMLLSIGSGDGDARGWEPKAWFYSQRLLGLRGPLADGEDE